MPEDQHTGDSENPRQNSEWSVGEDPDDDLDTGDEQKCIDHQSPVGDDGEGKASECLILDQSALRSRISSWRYFVCMYRVVAILTERVKVRQLVRAALFQRHNVMGVELDSARFTAPPPTVLTTVIVPLFHFSDFTSTRALSIHTGYRTDQPTLLVASDEARPGFELRPDVPGLRPPFGRPFRGCDWSPSNPAAGSLSTQRSFGAIAPREVSC